MQLVASLLATRFGHPAAIRRSVRTVCTSFLYRASVLSILISIGQSSLPQACPVCLHEPVKADDCRPNKPLRATIKAFLKRKLVDQKKLSTDKGAAQSSSSAIPQALDPSAVVGSQKPPQVDTGTDQNQSARELSRLPTGLDEARASSDRHGVPTEAQRDVPQPSIEVSCRRNVSKLSADIQ